MLGRNCVTLSGSCVFLLGLLLLPGAAIAQFQLPGANFKRAPAAKESPGDNSANTGRPGSSDSSSSRPSSSPANPGKPVNVAAPDEDTLVGRTLRQNGRRGAMRFTKAAGGLTLSNLALGGDVISKPGATCKIEVPGGPFPVRFSGFTEGLRTYKVESKVCPFSFVVLDGALISTHRKSSFSTGLGKGTCVFEKQDCRGYLAGFWGPSGRSFTKKTYRGIEKARGKSDREARANFRALLRANRGDRKGVRAVAADQAGFSARREVRCRDFLREHVHGFCASRITEARAVELGARLNETIKRRNAEYKAKQAERRAKRSNKRRRR